ncbi:MAG: acyl-CoA dehydrogenase [Gammaproteobacteria bacterium]
MFSLIWLLAFLGVAGSLAYRRVDLRRSTLTIGLALLVYSAFGSGFFLWFAFLWICFAGLVILNVEDIRRNRITAPLFDPYKSMVPTLSDTEREALEAGTVSWDGELFTGQPDWNQLMGQPAPELTETEQQFLDGPVEKLCRMIDNWDVSHNRADLSKKTWSFIKKHGFFAMIIPVEYGGLGFSPVANAAVLAKLSSRSIVAATTVAVPNSLGPAELLLHYGTEEQKQRYLPGLAKAKEIPCFALTGPRAGSDATAMVDTGFICKGEWEGEEVTGIRLNWDKRYITLAPVATVLGLAFKLYDPDHLLGTQEDLGITAALIPTDTPGVEIGRRHHPLSTPFQNGPTQGHDVFVPLDAIIGGPERAGQGWKMLVELLSAGRGISLPSEAMGAGQAALYATGAYARLRRQFNLPISKFEGVEEVIARMAGNTYILNAATSVTVGMIARGENPAVPSAIVKYHCTELGRDISDDAMDVQGGKGIMMGPKNYLAHAHQSVPISITVEGANILTRCLIIYGQGAIRCHPFVLKEMEAAKHPDHELGLRTFDELLFGHIGYAVSNAVRSFFMALTHANYTQVPIDGPTARFYQHINRFSSAFALASDTAMLVMGGDLKRRESLSARLGDVFSCMYLASMILKHYENQGRPEDDLPLVEWACRSLLYQAQEQLHGFLRNFPNRIISAGLRACIFPRGRTYFAPSDDLGQAVAGLVTSPTASRERLCSNIYKTVEPTNPLGLLQETLELSTSLAPLEEKIRSARRSGIISATATVDLIDSALKEDVISAAEHKSLRKLDTKIMTLIAVDDFAPEELIRSAAKASTKSNDTDA